MEQYLFQVLDRKKEHGPVALSRKSTRGCQQGGAWPGACVTAHWWWESRRLSKATTKPASTSTFLAIARGFQVSLLSCAQVGRQAVDRADEIGNGIKRRGLTPCGSSGALQALAHDVGLRTPAPARFHLDLGYERLRQAYGQSFHLSSVLRYRQACKTEREIATLPSARKRRYADEVMGLLTQEEKARYANVGRNDPYPCGSRKKFKCVCTGENRDPFSRSQAPPGDVVRRSLPAVRAQAEPRTKGGVDHE
jgi:hypothetical protein